LICNIVKEEENLRLSEGRLATKYERNFLTSMHFVTPGIIRVISNKCDMTKSYTKATALLESHL